MYLKSLTLKGFKSFADKTNMLFDPGLTVVVGPNGSGKSNVSDAILWVLGEQSAKQLRGQAMQDVIFAGSSARKPVGLAEVTLVLDNSDHTLPIDFAEVAITRRMYRSGESEYLINGAPSRLMDVTDILHDSGLGKDTHSIISQGKLDSILSSRPEERRSLIEEAADISKHRRRKERSERKLAAMDEHLAKAKIVAREVGRQLRPLERQVEKAKRARELESELSELTQILAVDDLRRLKEEHARLETRRKEAEAAVDIARYRHEEKSAELEKLQILLEQKGLFVGDLGEQRRRMQDQLGRMDASMLLLEEKGKNMSAKLSEMKSSLASMEKDRREAKGTHERVSRNLVEESVLVESLEARVAELTQALEDARAKRQEAEKQSRELAEAERAANSRADRETLAYAKLEDQLAGAEVAENMYLSRLQEIDESLSQSRHAHEAALAKKAELSSGLERARREAEEARESIGAAQAELKEAQEAERASHESLSTAKATLEALKAVAHDVETSSPLVAHLAESEATSGLVECRLSDLFEAPAELEALVERLLGDDLSALVVADAGGELALAREAGASATGGVATVVSHNDMEPETAQDCPFERLVGLLTVVPGAEGMIGRLLGGVYVVDGGEEAVLAAHEAAPGLAHVSPDGRIMALPDGRVRLGAPASAVEGTLERKRRIRALTESVQELESAWSCAAAELEAAEAALAAARDTHAKAQGDAARIQGELTSATGEIGRLEARIAQAQGERAQVEEARAASAERAVEARDAIEGHRKAASEARSEAEALAAQAKDAATVLSEALAEERGCQDSLSEQRLQHAMARERKNNLSRREQDLTRRVKGLDMRIESTERSSQTLEVMCGRTEPLHESLLAILESAQAWAARLRDRASLAEADSDSLKETIREAREAVDEASQAFERARQGSTELRVDESRIEVQVEHAIERIRETGAILEEALGLPAPENRDECERRSLELRRKLDAIGPVNAVAMEEYERLRERAAYIDEQVADLESARASLKKITAAIERKMRTRFLTVFDAVNKNFSEIFAMLFPGGAAHLELTDPDNLSETGVEVIAQPRGKKLTKMMLMSGGEKSLTALALLFATYKARTVPFYVFDEVEAALDDSNLSKLLDAIDQLKETTQLIVITHQRRTMEQADVLYGVSMQADGVSRVVSQRLDRATGKVVDL